MKINWKVRIKNKDFWTALIPAALILVQTIAALADINIDLGVAGEKLLGVVNAVFMVLAILGIVNDPTTEGMMADSKQALNYSKPKKE